MILNGVNLPGVSYCGESISPGYHTVGSQSPLGYHTAGNQSLQGIILRGVTLDRGESTGNF